jgi:hypothetical protein
MAKKKKQQESEYSALPPEWVEKMNGSVVYELDIELREVVNNVICLIAAEKLDPHLAELKEQLASAQEFYKHGKKIGDLKAKFLLELLRARGVNIKSVEEFLAPVGLTVDG